MRLPALYPLRAELSSGATVPSTIVAVWGFSSSAAPPTASRVSSTRSAAGSSWKTW